MVNFGYPYNDIVICKDSTDYLQKYVALYKKFLINYDNSGSSEDISMLYGSNER